MRRIFLYSLLLLIGCSALSERDFTHDKIVTEKMRYMMLGEWCGEKTHRDGTYQKWLVYRFPDGTYKIDFTKIGLYGDAENWGEYGMWGIRNPIYFTAMRGFIENGEVDPADPTDATYYDAYRVLSLTETEFTYKSYTSGNTFTVNRQCVGGRR